MKSKTKEPREQTAEATFTPAHVKSILVPIDFSEPSLEALRCAMAFAKHFGAKIVLLHVVEPIATPDMEYIPMTYSSDRVAKLAARKLQVLSKPHGAGGPLIEQAPVRTGKPFREITEAARELKIDLIIIATHGYTGLERALLGSTAERVVRLAPCPVMTLRKRE